MSFFDILKWFFDFAGIKGKVVALITAIIVILNFCLYFSYPVIKLLIGHHLLLKIIANVVLTALLAGLFGSFMFHIFKTDAESKTRRLLGQSL